MSAEPTWRVYLREWLTVYTSDYNGERGMAECLQHLTQKYAGRVRVEDWQTVVADPMRPDGSARWLKLRLPNLRGEFKDRAEAMDWCIQLPHAQLVQRGSDEEKELLAYGKKMLPDAG